MNNIDIAFIILHYLTYKDTIEAVKSIKNNLKNINYKIVIVDNGSPNETGMLLKKKYREDSSIDIIINAENLGFAKGNNIGFKYALNLYKPQFIVLLNNDILILQDDIYEKIRQEYQKSKFAVLGPMIQTADGKCNSSPVKNAPITEIDIKNNLKKENILYNIEKIHVYWILELFRKIKILVRKNDEIQNEIYNTRLENVVLHGCFWIFSPQYYKHFSGLDDSTFLYHEEEILYIKTTSLGLKTVYNPDIIVYHKEDSASNEMMPKGHNKRMFKFKNCLHSSCELLRIYKEYNYDK